MGSQAQDVASDGPCATPHSAQESFSQTNLSFAPGAAAARMATFMPGDHSKSGPPSTERRQASTCTGNLRVVTRPAESMASTQMLTSPVTSGVQGQDAEGSPWRIDPQRDQPPCSQTNLYLTEPALPETDRPSSHSSPSRGDPPSAAFAERPSREKSSDRPDILLAGSSKEDEVP